ncbi:hypothetical protein J4Q44_G00093240 [Coregonus suidteri]|uniref:Uncharacterized protein n=1 Tax=Coregonus suidteri TaxID=861788 RepID=A0AAN8M6M2_9TELE
MAEPTAQPQHKQRPSLGSSEKQCPTTVKKEKRNYKIPLIIGLLMGWLPPAKQHLVITTGVKERSHQDKADGSANSKRARTLD